MRYTSRSIEQLIEQFAKLPGIGRKTAQRLAMFVLQEEKPQIEALAQAILDVKDKVTFCSQCQNVTDSDVDPCLICASNKRNKKTICVVQSPSDVLAFERTNQYNGLYHVLHGVISPLDGIGPDDLKIRELLKRLQAPECQIEEIVLAINPTVEGETTVLYLSKLLKPIGLKLSRIARGIPVGSELEYIDEATLTRAFQGRDAL